MSRRPGSLPNLDPQPLPVVHLARDHPRPDIEAQVRSGAWVRVRHAAYTDVRSSDDRHARRRLLALARMVALREQLTAPYTLSHESAAMLWGLPLLTPPSRTHLIQASKPTTRGVDVVRHVHDLPGDQRTGHRGHPVTTLERTVVDCAMSLGAHDGIVVADAALHAGADLARCLAIIAGMTGRRGAPTARAVLSLADDGAESPGESSARFVLLRAGVPVPETQIEVRTHLGTFWSDFGWRGWRLLVEYDGRRKYSSNGTASEAVVQEKRRQDAIEEEGWRMLRVIKEDVRQPAALLRRLARALPAGTLDQLSPRRDLNALQPTSHRHPCRRRPDRTSHPPP